MYAGTHLVASTCLFAEGVFCREVAFGIQRRLCLIAFRVVQQIDIHLATLHRQTALGIAHLAGEVDDIAASIIVSVGADALQSEGRMDEDRHRSRYAIALVGLCEGLRRVQPSHHPVLNNLTIRRHLDGDGHGHGLAGRHRLGQRRAINVRCHLAALDAPRELRTVYQVEAYLHAWLQSATALIGDVQHHIHRLTAKRLVVLQRRDGADGIGQRAHHEDELCRLAATGRCCHTGIIVLLGLCTGTDAYLERRGVLAVGDGYCLRHDHVAHVARQIDRQRTHDGVARKGQRCFSATFGQRCRRALQLQHALAVIVGNGQDSRACRCVVTAYRLARRGIAGSSRDGPLACSSNGGVVLYAYLEGDTRLSCRNDDVLRVEVQLKLVHVAWHLLGDIVQEDGQVLAGVACTCQGCHRCAIAVALADDVTREGHLQRRPVIILKADDTLCRLKACCRCREGDGRICHRVAVVNDSRDSLCRSLSGRDGNATDVGIEASCGSIGNVHLQVTLYGLSDRSCQHNTFALSIEGLVGG